jgi:hypothetical protein
MPLSASSVPFSPICRACHPDHPGRNARSSTRRRHPPRPTSGHRRRAGHPRPHPRGAPRSSRPITRCSTKRPRRSIEPDSSCRHISPARNASQSKPKKRWNKRVRHERLERENHLSWA